MCPLDIFLQYPSQTPVIQQKEEICFQKSSFPKSGRRDSNPRPSAWKANALSTELLPQESGQRWIRTTEGVSQQIYSLPHLATLVFAHHIESTLCFVKEHSLKCGAKIRLLFISSKRNQPFLLQSRHILNLYYPNARQPALPLAAYYLLL